MLPNLQPAGHGLIVWDQPSISSAFHSVPTFGNSKHREIILHEGTEP
jgi:hypothetical protein